MKQSYVIRCTDPDWMPGQYLQGPRTPAKVARDGYGFTPGLSAAWPFLSKKQALAKRKILARHFVHGTSIPVGAYLHKFEVTPMPADGEIVGAA